MWFGEDRGVTVGAFLKDCVPYGKGEVSGDGIISLRLGFLKTFCSESPSWKCNLNQISDSGNVRVHCNY